MTKIQAIRGMNDILPNQTRVWQKVESILREIFSSYHYEEIRLPILEKTELFKRSIGEVTDIVEKEMYTFLDRNGESLTLRPEGTASCVRAAIEHGMLYHQTQKLWYQGPMYRYERPQRGRYRQFYQVGVEAFGFSGYLIEAELILVSARFFKKLGLKDLSLHLNCLGNSQSRLNYRKIFVEYCKNNIDLLDEDSQRRLSANPLRILDSKNPNMHDFLKNAPRLVDYLDAESNDNFSKLKEILSQNEIGFVNNPYLVRGLDYYTGTVFEWITPHLGAQSAVCAGGRYDGLVEQLGGEATSAVGFAMGLERIIELCGEMETQPKIDVYFIVGENTDKAAIKIAELLRTELPRLCLEVNLSGGSFKSQFKKADKSGARFALILGEDELVKNVITCKDLRGNQPQVSYALDELLNHLRSHG